MAFHEADGQQIHYEDTGTGEAVLLMPGWAGSIVELNPLRAALDGYRVIAVDPPGSGKSLPQPREYPPSFYRDDAATVLGLLDALGVEAAHLVGFSDGGEYALVMAEQAPQRALSVVTWGAAGHVTAPPGRTAALESLMDEPGGSFVSLAAYLAEAYGVETGRAMAASWGRALEAIIEAGGDVSREAAHRIMCPALLITGTYDPYCGPDLVRAMATAIPRGRFTEAVNSGHAVHIDSRDWLVSTVVDWLDGH